MQGLDFGRPAPLCVLTLFWALAVPCLPAGAAVELPPGVAQDHDTIYRLSEKASLVQGCFPPCYCPVLLPAKIVGTFVLASPVFDGEVERRQVREVNWTASSGDDSFTITGSGLYLVEHGAGADNHSLELDLSIDDQPSQHFSSGLVPGDGGAAADIDLTVSVNGMVCHDVVIEVKASPVPALELRDYELLKSSSYQEGCFLLCDCLLLEPKPMSGRFTVVPVEALGNVWVFAVNLVDLTIDPASDEAFELTGFGTYTLIQGFAGPFHILKLKLSRDGGVAELYDHAENTAPTFPGAIDIEVDQNDRVCFDRVLGLHAVLTEPLWHDGFESGDTTRWSRCTP